MATISRDPASKKYRIHFRFGGQQFHKSLKTADETQATAALPLMDGDETDLRFLDPPGWSSG